MTASISSIPSVWEYLGKLKSLFMVSQKEVETVTVRSISFNGSDTETTLRSISFKDGDLETILSPNGSGQVIIKQSLSFKNWEPEKTKLETTVSFKNQCGDDADSKSVSPKNCSDNLVLITSPRKCFNELTSPRPISELDAAAVKLQKVYKSYRTRRNLADCAVVVEELWWKALDFAALKRSSVSFFDIKKPETAVSRWARARTRAAKVGKGLSKDEKAQKLALQHWLEAIDPRHRYGHNLHFYYDVWFDSESVQPFFYWLDVGDGKEVNLDRCPRPDLQRQCIKYLGPKEREAYEVIVGDGKLIYKQNGDFVDTVEGSKWIFVLSTSRALYVAQKKKGVFQHSSFLSGGATSAAGRLVAENGVLKAIWPYSGHYLPTEENFNAFVSFLEENKVDLTNVKRCSTDDDSVSFKVTEGSQADLVEAATSKVSETNVAKVSDSVKETAKQDDNVADIKVPTFQLGNRLSCKWTTGLGPRIGCVRDYPAELQFKALEQVNLSPRTSPMPFMNCGPIPSPRPSPRVRLSPRLSGMGIPSPRVTLLPMKK